MIIGESGTGKTGFINSYFSKFPNYLIKRVDSETPIKVILSLLSTRDYFYDKKIVIYDDSSINKDIIKVCEKIVPKTQNKVKFIVIINTLKGLKPKKFIIHKTRYPKDNEILNFLKNKPSINEELIKAILNLKIKSLRKIEMALEDGYIIEDVKIKEKFNILKLGSFMTSLAIAENLARLKKFDESLCEMDKLKKYNEDIYYSFIKLYYPNLPKMRLRYPKQLYDLIKKR